MHVAVVRFPGSNCDHDAEHVLDKVVVGSHARLAWHKDSALGECDAVVVPGGFSYGDYLRAGAMAAHSPIMADVKRFAERGGPVLGICNGFQILCESGLLEGALTRNHTLHFECKDVYVSVEGKPTPWTRAIPAGRILRMPIAHAEGRFLHTDIDALEKSGQIVFRYVDAGGAANESANPNGSLHNIAGIANRAGNVVGLMPHPERAAEEILGGTDGKLMFDSLSLYLSGKGGRV